MKLHIFQSGKGDCLLHESADGKLVLCDGGMYTAMKKFVRDELAKLRAIGRELEAVYVSHIDQDHISGVLTLLEDELAWRVHDHHRANGDTTFKAPGVPRPPVIHRIWHNAFRDQVPQNSKPIDDLLAAAVPALLATSDPRLREAGMEMERVATSIPEALKVSGLASPKLLNIPVNQIPGAAGPNKLMMIRPGQGPIQIGSCRWSIVGPTEAELDDLRKGWNKWLQATANRDDIAKVREYIKDRVEKFSAGALSESPFDLGKWNGIPDTKGVSAPNVASLMFVVEENGKTVLLTGDSQQDIILKGLKQTGHLANGGALHLNVLKVQHHGSEHNMDTGFARTVSADHYVFCGNGEHGNPEPEVIQQIYDSRLGPPAKRGAGPNKPFKFWFSTASSLLEPGSKEHTSFTGTEALVKSLVASSGGKLKARFNTKPSVTLTV
ncbi:MAG: MBL fold metallo-hydrolase [Acidobacteria bacterium]|nr:MBL fold metallo-hydrolase [Acidobacteriota bacterium]